MSNVELKVNPQDLITTSDEMEAERQKIKAYIEEAKTQVNSLPSSWEADASSDLNRRFKELDTSFTNLTEKIINEHIADLKVAAEAYRQAKERVGAIVAEPVPRIDI